MVDFATRQELANWLSAPAPGILNSQADLALATASARIRSFCGWHIYPVVTGATYTVRRPTVDVGLPTRMLTAASATLNGSAVTVSFDSNGTVRPVTWCALMADTVVTYTHGYAAVPDDVKEACLRLASQTMAAGALTGVRSESIGGYSVTYGVSQVGVDVEPLLFGYRLVTLA